MVVLQGERRLWSLLGLKELRLWSISVFYALPAQLKPFPVKPVWHVQLNEPAVFWQTALTSHTGTEALHSSMSEIKYRNVVVRIKIPINFSSRMNMSMITHLACEWKILTNKKIIDTLIDNTTRMIPPSVAITCIKLYHCSWMRVVKGIFVTRDRLFFFPLNVKWLIFPRESWLP